MIKEASSLFFRKFEIESQILAYIKNENIPSIKSFEKAGFGLLKKEKEYIILKLRKSNLSISK